MKIYILKAFPNAHKWFPDEEVIGYFASRAALRKAIKKHEEKLGNYGGKDCFNALKRDNFGAVNTFLETGLVEIVTAEE